MAGPTQGTCEGAAPATRYNTFSVYTAGNVTSICDGDWSAALTNAATIASWNPATFYFDPDPYDFDGFASVSVDGTALADGWRTHATSVIFDVGAYPAVGAAVALRWYASNCP